jgi:hypothetical protein
MFEGFADSALLVEQQSADSRRCLDDDETGLAADVADVAESDGLSDAISSPERTDGSEFERARPLSTLWDTDTPPTAYYRVRDTLLYEGLLRVSGLQRGRPPE